MKSQLKHLGFCVGLMTLWGCQGNEKMPPDTVSNDDSTGNRLEGLTDNLGDFTQTEHTWHDDASGSLLTLYALKRPSTTDIPSEDRGFSKGLFFFNEDLVPALEIETYANYVYEYAQTTEDYRVTVQLKHADFSTQETTFSLRDETLTTTQISPGTESITDLALSACRFNRKLLEYAASNLQQRIGDGECWTLIDFALKSAGAHEPLNYRFGNLIGEGNKSNLSDLNHAMPGDIIQFDSGLFIDSNGYENQAGSPNHTALIRSIEANAITVFEQNSPIGDPVVIGHYDFETLQSGSFRLYRAFPTSQSPQSSHCNPPAGIVNAYSPHIGKDSSGSQLSLISLNDKPDFVELDEFCQYQCDSMPDCFGYLRTSNDCTLKGQGSLMQSGGVRFMEKVTQ